MLKKSLTITFGLLLLAGPALAAGKLELKDETAKISYSLGYQIGGDFKNQGVGITPEAVVQGIQDALAAAEPLLSQQEMNDLLVSLKQKVVAVQHRENFQSGMAFMAENLKKPGVKALPGGIQYRVLTAGTGASPTLEDTVDIHFQARRSDGTAIATTHTAENTPRTYQVKKTLPALQQVLQKMSPGAKWEVVIPPSSRNELMEGAGVLIYEIELLAVHPASK